MDGRTSAALACAVAGGVWVLLGLALVARRIRFVRRTRVAAPSVVLPPERAVDFGWTDGFARAQELQRIIEADDPGPRVLLEQALRSDEPAVRRTAVTALGRLGDRHDWAVDVLIEALAESRDTPARVAAQLDRFAPRVGTRLVPLLGHPSSVVRFYAVRLLARYGDHERRLAAALVRDPSPNVRAAALETLRAVATGDALRSALQQLDDPHPQVRAHACRTACSISGASAAAFVVLLLGDASWWVRAAARKALVGAGSDAAPAVLAAIEHEDADVRSGAALVLQDLGVVDELLTVGGSADLLEKIFAAGGERLRSSATERARRGLPMRRGPHALPSGAGS